MKNELEKIDFKIQKKQKKIIAYKQKRNTEIMALTTDIASLQKKHEEKCTEKVAIKSKEEEDNASQNKKVSELSKVVMALDNLEKVFTKRAADGKT